ncbi:PepSY-associated TM helix domain-containing protein [Aequorivita marisscotiae]|uniref:PepSY domain-containing protein n=1 Tax=Aequorivita marisscotiae TaxID=3040348 RepID=A0ABY8KPJ4_9FLAO|nr:PepSY domain-containing protein [Aequorivita sp. Ant34-E75]WGF91379.1 PepSY domain-containing protein [Aequorivita sp. Ant34-E75]
MKKNLKLHQWLMKWHFISGVIILPFVLILSVTGFIYLFKNTYESPQISDYRNLDVKNERLTFQEQWEIAGRNSSVKPHSVILSGKTDEATEFISGKFANVSHLFVNPYNGAITGEFIENESPMGEVRNMHGSLFLGVWGGRIIELVGCWLFVMLLTGIYIWWPVKKWSVFGFFIPRIKRGRRTFFRDIHAISGFWISILLVMILAGGLPWTEVFGNNFKKLQKITNTGYPATWDGQGLQSWPTKNAMSLDEMILVAKKYPLLGTVSLRFPKGKDGIFSVSNTYYKNLNAQKVIHFDQYSGRVLALHKWSDVGFLMRGRMWLMAFHQGQLGAWNFLLIACTASLLFIMSLAAIISYLLRKPKGKLQVPNVPSNFHPGKYIFLSIVILGLILPLFGLSVLLIALLSRLPLRKKQAKNS